MSYQSTQRWRYKAKTWLIRYMGNRCGICKYDRYNGNLVAHHVDSTTKIETISRLINGCQSWDAIIAEADKCVLICHNCHGEVHAGLATAPTIDVAVRKEVLKAISAERPIPKNKQLLYCPCGKIVVYPNKYCSQVCYHKKTEKIRWPGNLSDLVAASSQSSVARQLGVSDKAVEKRLKRYFGATERT